MASLKSKILSRAYLKWRWIRILLTILFLILFPAVIILLVILNPIITIWEVIYWVWKKARDTIENFLDETDGSKEKEL